MSNNLKLLSAGEIAIGLGRSLVYVYFMRNAGFPMPGKRATLEAALDWLRANPDFVAGRHRKKPQLINVNKR